MPTYKLVQDLLTAERDLELPRALRKLDNFELLILDDIGYVQQAGEEVEVSAEPPWKMSSRPSWSTSTTPNPDLFEECWHRSRV